MEIVSVSGVGQDGLRILQLLADGNSFIYVARELGKSEQMIKNYMVQIRAKLGADNTTHAVAMALRRKMID
jgi:two-component system NarL family response regulator